MKTFKIILAVLVFTWWLAGCQSATALPAPVTEPPTLPTAASAALPSTPTATSLPPTATAMPIVPPTPPATITTEPTTQEPAGALSTAPFSLEKSIQQFPRGTFQAALGDLDGDGDLDAVFANPLTHHSAVWLNDGSGTFSNTNQKLTQYGHGVGVSDLDGDGDLDAVIACHQFLTPSKVYRNDGAGVFQEAQDFGDAAISGAELNLLDLNSDGYVDVHIMYYAPNGVPDKVYLNDGQAHFTDSGLALDEETIAWGDLDGDGDTDYFGKRPGVGYGVMRNDGNGQFSASWQLADTQATVGGIALADFDGDGDLDALVANGFRDTGSFPSRLFWNDGGQFTDSEQSLNVTLAAELTVGDLDSDGDLDVVVANMDLPNEIWLNDGQGHFTDSGLRLGERTHMSTKPSLGDLDGDGDLDLFIGSLNGAPEIWFNTPVSPTALPPTATPTQAPPTATPTPPTATPTPTMTPTSAVSADTGVDLIDDTLAPVSAEAGYTPVFEAGDCRFKVPRGYQVECGDLIVPESRRQPAGPTIRLHIGVFKSKNPNAAPDPVIHLMGGPGASPLDFVDQLLSSGGSAILKQRDYILFSQRGTNYAEPFLDCPGLADFQWGLVSQPLSPAERTTRELEFWNDCRDDLVAQGINLAAYTSAESAADVNDLRLALGYEKVNLYGISYGTRLALTVLRDHPEGVRSAIIDSVWPLQVALDHEFALNAYRGLRVFFDACTADAYCAQTYPDLEATFYQVLQELTANPITFQFARGAVLVDGADFLGATYAQMYSVVGILQIPEFIANAAKGDYYQAFFKPGESKPYARGMQYTVRCSEEFAFESQAAALALAADLPFEFQDLFVNTYEYALCDAWGIGTDDPRENAPVVSDVPTLVLSGYYDPVTPPTYGRLAAETLSHGYFIEFPTLSHGVMRSDKCALAIGLAFLDDPTVAPDVSCMDDLTGPEFAP